MAKNTLPEDPEAQLDDGQESAGESEPGTETPIPVESAPNEPPKPPNLGENTVYREPTTFYAEESEFHAPKDAHMKATRKKQGPQRQDGMPTGTRLPPPALHDPIRPQPLPRPPFTMYKSDATNPNQRSKAFWNWWNAVPSWVKDVTLAYVYRDWPCLVLVDDNNTNIDKISGNEPIQDDVDLLHKYGCGSYRVRFNDARTGGGTMVTVWITNLGGTDLKSNPPVDKRVSDVDQVDLTRKENSSYVEFLRMRGLLPEANNSARETERMANVEAVKEAVGGVERMANKMIEMADRKAGEGNITNEMIRDSVATANDITKQAVTYALKVKDDAHANETAATSTVGSTTEMFNLMMSMMDRMAEIRGGGGGTDPGLAAELVSLRAQVDKMRDQQIETLRNELVALRANPQQSGQSQSSLFDQIKALKELKGVIDEIGLGSKEPEGIVDTVASVVKDDIPPWMTKYVLPLAGQIIPAFLAARGGMPMPPGAPGTGGQQVPVSMPNPQQNTTGGPQLVPQPQLTAPRPVAPQMPPVTMDPMDNMLNYVAMPLLNYLADNDTNGSHFGEWVVSGFGEEILEEAQKYGADPMVAAIRRHSITGPGIAEINPPMPEGRLERFVGEFLSYKPNYADESTPATMATVPEGAA